MKNVHRKKAMLEKQIREQYLQIIDEINILEYNHGYKISIELVESRVAETNENFNIEYDLKALLIQYKVMQNKALNVESTYPLDMLNSVRLSGMIEGLIEGARELLNIELNINGKLLF